LFRLRFKHGYAFGLLLLGDCQRCHISAAVCTLWHSSCLSLHAVLRAYSARSLVSALRALSSHSMLRTLRLPPRLRSFLRCRVRCGALPTSLHASSVNFCEGRYRKGAVACALSTLYTAALPSCRSLPVRCRWPWAVSVLCNTWGCDLLGRPLIPGACCTALRCCSLSFLRHLHASACHFAVTTLPYVLPPWRWSALRACAGAGGRDEVRRNTLNRAPRCSSTRVSLLV